MIPSSNFVTRDYRIAMREGNEDRSVDRESFGDEYNNMDPLVDLAAMDPKKPPTGKTAAPTKGGPQKGGKGKREMNPDFKDVKETGKWGKINKREILIVSLVVIGVVVGVIVLAVTLTSNKDAPPVGTRPPVATPTMAPSMQTAPEDQLAAIRNVTQFNPILNESTLALLPDNVTFYKTYNDTTPAVQQAMSWLLFYDAAHEPAESIKLVPRFALAVLYFNHGGWNWKNTTNWLSGEDICNWHGVLCDRLRNRVEEIDLTQNNLVGSLPNELNLFQDIRSLWLRRNALTGTIPALPIGQLPLLTSLYLDENQLTGTVGADLRANHVLSTVCLLFFCFELASFEWLTRDIVPSSQTHCIFKRII